MLTFAIVESEPRMRQQISDAANRKLQVALVVALLAGVFLVRIVPLLQEARQTGGGGPWCPFSLKGTMLALHNYHQDYGSFPPAVVRDESDTPIHSWRALLLPYMGNSGEYDFSQPWNSPSNLRFAEEHRWQHRFWTTCGCQKNEEDTVVVAVTGNRTAWPEDQVVSLDDVTDGHDTTIQLVAVSESGIKWLEPRDLSYDELPRTSAHGDGLHVAFVDGTAKFLPTSNRSPAMFTIAAGEKVSLNSFRPASEFRDY